MAASSPTAMCWPHPIQPLHPALLSPCHSEPHSFDCWIVPTVREELQLDAEFVIVEQTQMEYLSRAWTAPCCLSWQPTAHSSCSYLTYLPIHAAMEQWKNVMRLSWPPGPGQQQGVRRQPGLPCLVLCKVLVYDCTPSQEFMSSNLACKQ